MNTNAALSFVLTSIVLALTAAPAFANEDVEPPAEPTAYDFSPGFQYFSGAAGSLVLGAVGGIGGALIGGAACPRTSGIDFCPITVSIGGTLAGSLGGAMLGVSWTGGDHALGRDYRNALLGGAVGLAVGIPISLGGLALASGSNTVLQGVGVAGAVLGATTAGLGAAFGYQFSYALPDVEQLSIAPLMTDTHNGFSISGRF